MGFSTSIFRATLRATAAGRYLSARWRSTSVRRVHYRSTIKGYFPRRQFHSTLLRTLLSAMLLQRFSAPKRKLSYLRVFTAASAAPPRHFSNLLPTSHS